MKFKDFDFANNKNWPVEFSKQFTNVIKCTVYGYFNPGVPLLILRCVDLTTECMDGIHPAPEEEVKKMLGDFVFKE